MRTALPLLLALSGCYGNTWEIAITGHVFDEDVGGLVAAPGERVTLCWSIATHVEPTERRAEALIGCETMVTSASGSFDTALYGVGGAYIEDLYVELWRGEERALGSVAARHSFMVTCPSTYTYADDDGAFIYYEDECADDLYEAISYEFIFPR